MTTSFQLNVGYRYVRACESRYATSRRLLSVNPGISQNRLKEIQQGTVHFLRQKNAEFLGDELEGYFHEKNGLKKRATRQCPTCATQLYHSLAHEIPWITRCPIHLEPLLDRCAICQRRIRDIDCPSHRCNGCGTVDFEHLCSLPNMILEPFNGNHLIETLKLILPPCTRIDCSSWLNASPTFEWIRCGVNDGLYPSMIKAKDPELISDSFFSDMTIPRVDPLMKEADLVPFADSAQLCRDTKNISFYRSLQELETLLPLDFAATNTVLSWTNSHTSPQHAVVYADYHRTDHEMLRNENGVCPYCMAFSIWFRTLAESKYSMGTLSYRHRSLLQYYDCPWGAMVSDLYPGRFHVQHEGKVLSTSATFNQWLYNRGVLISFKEIFRHCQSLATTTGSFHHTASDANLSFSPERKFVAKVVENRCKFWFVPPQTLPASARTDFPECEAFQSRLNRYNDFYRVRRGSPLGPTISYTEFLALHEGIRATLPGTLNCRYAAIRQARDLIQSLRSFGQNPGGNYAVLIDSSLN